MMDISQFNMNLPSPDGPHYTSEEMYLPLDPDLRQIRLCYFEPMQYCGKPTRLTLRTVNLGPIESQLPGGYFALSYEWNPPCAPARPKDEDIPPDKRYLYFLEINGKEVPATINLLKALYVLQVKTPLGKLFWIDAICINQSNHTEKAQQIGLMRDIYSIASRVFVWTHTVMPVSGDGKRAFYSLLQLCKPGDSRSDSIAAIRAAFFDSNLQAAWNALGCLISSSYWTRCWIIQELAVARQRNLLLVFSDYEPAVIDLDPVIQLCQRVCGFLQRRLESGEATTKMSVYPCEKRVDNLMHFFNNPSTNSNGLYETLTTFGAHGATDERDKIYSLLGITTPYKAGHIEISYDCSSEQVFERAARSIILGSGHLEILSLAGSSNQSLPSWAPDWSQHYAGRVSLYAVDQTEYWHPAPKLDENSRTLRLQAFHGARIMLSSNSPSTDQGPATMDQIEQALRLMEALLRETFLLNRELTHIVEQEKPASVSLNLVLYDLVVFMIGHAGLIYLNRKIVSELLTNKGVVITDMLLAHGSLRPENFTDVQKQAIVVALAKSRTFCFVRLRHEFFTPQKSSLSRAFPGSIWQIIRKHSDKLVLPCICQINDKKPLTEEDCVAVVPGCSYPLILEPTEPGSQNHRIKGIAWCVGFQGSSFRRDLPYSEIQIS